MEMHSKNGEKVPLIGLGTYPMKGEKAAKSVYNAIEIGYRIIDTSDDYQNEDGIGDGCNEAIRNNIVTREELFLQTKISDNHTYPNDPLAGVYFCENSTFMKKHSVKEVVLEKIEQSLRNLKTDYLDSVLIHLPYVGFFTQIWETLCQLKEEGVVRYIGVSNCRERHFELLKEAKYQPDIHQFYMSPVCTKEDVQLLCNKRDVQMMTYSPLIDIRRRMLDPNTFSLLTNKYNKSNAQILLRWNIEKGSIPLPKSESVERLKENFDALNFSLTTEDVKKLDVLNINSQYMAESRMCPGL